jgi:PII-like signaling protein
MTTRTQGVHLRFYVHENRRHHGILLYEWLLEQAKKMGIHGGTAYRAIAGFGRHGVMHEQHFFELAGDVAVAVDFFVTFEEADKLIKLSEQENLSLFYAEIPTEFGVISTEG